MSIEEGSAAVVDIEQYNAAMELQESWSIIVDTCKFILNVYEIDGYITLLEITPTVPEMITILDKFVVPVLDKLIADLEYEPNAAMNVDNLRQYSLHLRIVAKRVLENDQDAVHAEIQLLKTCLASGFWKELS